MAEDLIVSVPGVLGGRPCVRGTRLSVEFLLELAAGGATQADILADENVGPAVVAGLRQIGWDVRSVAEALVGASDAAVLGRAIATDRVAAPALRCWR